MIVPNDEDLSHTNYDLNPSIISSFYKSKKNIALFVWGKVFIVRNDHLPLDKSFSQVFGQPNIWFNNYSVSSVFVWSGFNLEEISLMRKFANISS